MARVYYERLSEESAHYLDSEHSRRREHTAMILVFEGGPLATPEGGADYARIRQIVEARLPELPRLRTKLRRVPIENHPVWVDDREFNLDYHLRQSSLPRPGNHDQLCRTASRIAATRLDRSRPLWDCWVIEGVEGGRFALVLKMHKALANLEGADLFRALLSADPEATAPPPARFSTRPAPSPVELFTSEVLARWSPSRRAWGRAIGLLTTPGRARRQVGQRAANVLKVMGYQLRPASESPFDGNLSPHRAFAVQEVELARVQAIRQALGGTVHDTVLTILTGALRRFVETLRVSPTAVDLRGVTPILAASREAARAWVVELPVWEPSGEGRQEILAEQTRRIRLE
ncbi:MAG: wax ester/triacylglycerol synthase domain-containing protein, partial [Myxococcota bacterium]